MRRLALLVALGVAVLATAAIAGGAVRAAAGPEGVKITPLAHGTLAKTHAKGQGIDIRTNGVKDMLITAIRVAPGGSFGWHTHPGPVLVAVSKGTLDVYEPDGKGGCAHATVSAGDAFVEGGGHVHLASNKGSTPVELNATFLAKHGTTSFLKTVPQPAGC